MKVIKITPRGYCKGVVRAIQLVKDARKSYPGPIYVLGMIVHNSFVSDALYQLGVTSLDTSAKTKEQWIDSLHHGLLVFTAHGISPKIKQRAIDRGLEVLDASCADVLKTQELIHKYRSDGYDVIYIGKKGHPEAQAMQNDDEHIHLVETSEDIALLNIASPDILVTNQTTMSILDIASLIEEIRIRFPNAVVWEEVCDATRVRQQAVIAMKEANVLIVVGDRLSNNSNRLHSINPNIQKRYMIESLAELNPAWLHDDDVVAVTSGASTPTYITAQVIEYLEQFKENDPATHHKPALDMNKIL